VTPHRSSFRPLVCLLAVAVCATATGTGAAIGGSIRLAEGSTHAGAAHVRLTIELRYEMQCEYPGSAPVVLTLPGHVPGLLDRITVLVNGKAARGVSARGHRVTVEMPLRPRIMCDLIGPGLLTIELTPRAGYRNPAAGGRYRVTAEQGRASFSAPLTITAA
jgi:hypothetical protein